MSVDSGEVDPWPSNGTYPALDCRQLETAESEYPPERPDYPTPEERVAGLLEAYPDRMAVPVSKEHGRKLRESVLDEPVTEAREIDLGSGETGLVEDTVSRSALPLVAAVWDLLDTYEKYRDLHLRMKKQVSYDEQDEFLIELDNSFAPSYQSGTYAKLMALKRQLIGGEYPDESACASEECSGVFDQPVTVLFGLTASVYNTPSRRISGFRPAADHDREIREAWTGSTNSVKRVLRDVLERKLGLSSDQYAWWYQSEPHPGDGPAAGYSHSHPVVILDASAASVPLEEIGPETFRPVVAKHVSLCDHATWDAHELEDSVTVRHPDEIKNFGSYVSKYLAIGPEKDLLERSDEYLMWAASQWSTTSQKYSKSRTATAAIKADRCHQEFADKEANQSVDHADCIVQSSKPGISYECACCGSHFGIPQEPESLSRARLDAIERRSTTDDEAEDEGPPQSLADRWPSADGAARVGSPVRTRECSHPPGSDQCPLCASETESPNHTVSGEVPIPDTAKAPPAPVEIDTFEREPQWRPDAVVRTWGEGEETPIGPPGGTVYGEIVVGGHDSIIGQCDLPRLPNVTELEGPEPWKNSQMITESDVRDGRVPPPELVSREWAETVQSGRRVTAKQWSTNWYADRYERSPSRSPDLTESELARIREFVKTTGETSIPSICGSLNIDPSHKDTVESVL